MGDPNGFTIGMVELRRTALHHSPSRAIFGVFFLVFA
jgi:hypothetical protein